MIRKIAMAVLFIGGLFAQSDLEQGIEWYNKRAEGHVNNLGQLAPISTAIEFLEKAYENPETSKEAALYLLKAYYFRGKLVYTDKDKKKVEFNKGTELGREMMEKYPDDIPFRYWYLVNLGSWSEVYGIFAAAKAGVADQMKEHSEYIIKNDPEYNDGSGYFMLGAVHFKTPYIPFLLSWPDNDAALANMEMANNTGLATPVQKVYLAQILYKDGQKDKARSILKEVINTAPRADSLVEDLDEINKAKSLLEDWS